MTEPSLYELLQKVTELQGEIKHQSRLLEEWRKESQKAFEKADVAEDTANEALATAQAVRDEIRRYRKDRKADIRWFIGVAIAVVMPLIPIFIRFYGN